MNILFPQILFQIINFSIVVGALTALLYRPILKILEERSKKIEEAQKAAQETLSEKNRLAELEKKILEKAEKEALEIIEKARQTAKKTELEALTLAQVKSESQLEKLKENWVDEKKQHLVDMKREFLEAVIATAQKLVGGSLDTKKHQQLIQDQLGQLLKTL